MKRSKEDFSSKLPLLEAVIVILIFVILSISILNIYSGANRVMKKAENNGRAMLAAENAAEAFRSTWIDNDKPALIYKLDGLLYELPLDGEYNIIYEENVSLNMSIATVKSDDSTALVNAQIEAEVEGESLILNTAVIARYEE